MTNREAALRIFRAWEGREQAEVPIDVVLRDKRIIRGSKFEPHRPDPSDSETWVLPDVEAKVNLLLNGTYPSFVTCNAGGGRYINWVLVTTVAYLADRVITSDRDYFGPDLLAMVPEAILAGEVNRNTCLKLAFGIELLVHACCDRLAATLWFPTDWRSRVDQSEAVGSAINDLPRVASGDATGSLVREIRFLFSLGCSVATC